jgi:hypothetical protein
LLPLSVHANPSWMGRPATGARPSGGRATSLMLDAISIPTSDECMYLQKIASEPGFDPVFVRKMSANAGLHVRGAMLGANDNWKARVRANVWRQLQVTCHRSKKGLFNLLYNKRHWCACVRAKMWTSELQREHRHIVVGRTVHARALANKKTHITARCDATYGVLLAVPVAS